MAIYPDIITGIQATLPLKHSTSRLIISNEFESGIETRRLVQDSHRRNVQIEYSFLTFPKANELRRFYEEMKGPFTAFDFYFPQIEVYVKELVGVMPEIISTTITLPSLLAQTYTLYKNDVALVEDTDWTFTEGIPGSSSDSADLIDTPVKGDIYHFSFSGRLRIKARFSESPISFSDVKKYWSSTTVELMGLVPEIL